MSLRLRLYRVMGPVLAAACVLQACTTPSAEYDLPDKVDYNFHIRPILSNSCYVCHGPDVSTREAGLRLDVREEAIARREEGGRAIMPGSARKSLLIQRLMAENPEERMPPEETNKTLSPREIALLSRWIEQGAEYKPHWALIAPVEPAIPSGTENPIDHLIDAQLNTRGLRPASLATKESLARRAFYVITGLPPSPEALQAFLEDDAPDAYEKLVDNLLASPHYGERWAQHWMDLVRYAESKGHEFDFTIHGAWRYRDYLIRAFNADLPYDQFITEHLAGDLLTTPRLHPVDGFDESTIGTTYFTLGEGKHSPVDTRIDEAERIDNIIDVTTKTFQGLTLACARCHDHKFDPIPTTDYYSFYGIVESARFTPIPLLSSHHRLQLDSIRVLRQHQRQRVADSWRSTLQTPVRLVALQDAGELPQDVTHGSQILGDFRTGTYDGWFPQGPAFSDMPIRGVPVVEEGRINSLASGVVTSRALQTGMPGALRSPTFTLEHDSIHVVAAGHKSLIRIIVDNFQLIRHPIHGGLEIEVNSPTPVAHSFDVTLWKGSKAYIELLVGIYDKKLWVTEQHTLLGDDAAYIEAAYAVAFDSIPPTLPFPEATQNASSQALQQAVDAWGNYSATQQQISLLNMSLQQGILNRPRVSTTFPHLSDIAYVMGMTDGDTVSSPVFGRGNYRTPEGDPVPHRFFTALDASATPFTASASGRLDLAQAITDTANPLTARVMVNRLWHHAFGRGIVKSVDNFGAQGSLPTHPALLDYLALRFMEKGWSVKAVLREIVLSQAFRRSTQASPGITDEDPENLLLSHYPVRRLEAEAIRDAILAVSGRLDTTMYGEPIPIHLTEFMKGRGRPQESGPLDGVGRRSLYISVRRNFLSPMMLAYDKPIPFSTFGARNSSNVPAQSLMMLNAPLVAEQARMWADTLMTLQHLNTEGKIRHMYLQALSRLPTEEEIAQGLAFLQSEAQKMDGTDDLAVWASYCHIVFNLKEFIYLV